MPPDDPFTPEQLAALAEPLNRAHVKTRSQSGQTLSYVEGWHAIAEANRIFGFGAWDRETLETRCVSERERLIGRQQKPGWGVTYTARVRIRVGAIVRDGCGAGHGIDVDLGLAHESALKEAETDAMKRALMTFGNPFGLALYDKQQREVAESEPEPESDRNFLVMQADQACTKSGLTADGITALCQELTGGLGSVLAELPLDLLQRLAQHGASQATVTRCNQAGQALANEFNPNS
jgi:DNA recombination protein Rad52